ncbi:zf-TFIIB domain-containing protein [Acidobacteriota bacterium]
MSPKKPSEKEDEYFAKMELERRKKHETEDQLAQRKKEREKLQKLCHMKCPKCAGQLEIIRFEGIEIDKCADCQGIWLDSGELNDLLRKEEGFVSKCFRFMGTKAKEV